MKNFLLLLNREFSFSDKNEYKLVAERRAAARREAKDSLKNPDWRRRQDSNLRWDFSHNGFQDHPLKPLRHSSLKRIKTGGIAQFSITLQGGPDRI